jgi:CubicO group peptidase (beta-lactamase class C family)
MMSENSSESQYRRRRKARYDRAATISWFAAVAAALLATNSASAQAAPGGPSAENPRGPIEYLQSELKRLQIPGAQLAVVRHGELIELSAFGVANVEHDVPATNQNSFGIFSITKAFTGVALMQLVEEGKLDLDAPISKYLDGLPLAWRAVRVRQLPTHMSGLPDIWIISESRLLVENDAEASWAKVQTLPMEFKPGERVKYNQTNMVLLKKIIEKLSGQSYTQFIVDRQFKVVGMPRTTEASWADDSTVVMGKARSYFNVRSVKQSDDWGDWPGEFFLVNTHKLFNDSTTFPSIMYPATGIESTAQELAHWAVALQEGRLITMASLKQMWTPGVLNDGTHGDFAIGWPIVDRPRHPMVLATGGERTALAIYPEDDLTVVLLTNLVGARPARFVDEIAASYLEDPSMRWAAGFNVPSALKPLHLELVQRRFDPDSVERDILAMKAKDPHAASETDLRHYGEYLFAMAHDDEALAILKLNTRLHPDSAAAYDALAAAYKLNGDEALANDTHSMAMELKRAQPPRSNRH